MTNSTISDKRNRIKSVISYGAAILFWLAVWHIISLKINKDIILVSPLTVVKRLLVLCTQSSFRETVMFSFVRISGGFMAALLSAVILAVLSSRLKTVRTLMSPVVVTAKAIPVASFVILALLWIPSRNLAVLVSFVMVFPVIYTNVLSGITNVGASLLEMAKVFGIPSGKRFLYIYLPDVMPFFVSACTVSLGLCWKSGIAAEVIGQPDGSIGDKLYRSKIYLETADLFAWTLVIITVSAIFERIFLALLKLAENRTRSGGVKRERLLSADGMKRKKTYTPSDISVEALCVSFDGETVLKDFSAELKGGGVYCITGKSGCGKTTLLNVLMGIVPAQSGSVECTDKISAVFQEDRLCGRLNAAANVKMVCAADVSDGEIGAELIAVGLDGESILKPVSELSGGMCRRTALVRAVTAESGVLILDEAFKGLDGETKELAVKYLLGNRRGRTVISVTHDMSEIESMRKLCDVTVIEMQ